MWFSKKNTKKTEKIEISGHPKKMFDATVQLSGVLRGKPKKKVDGGEE